MLQLRWRLISLVVLSTLLFAACASAPSQSARSNEAADGRSNAPSSAPAAAPPLPAATVVAGGSVNKDPATGSLPNLPGGQQVFSDRKIIYTGDMTMEVQDPAASLNDITQIAQSFGGYVASSNTSVQGDRQIATISLKIPAESYNEALIRLRKVANKITVEKTTSQDVSEEFSDLSAQLKTLQATEARYIELLARANTIDEVLKVQQQIASVRTQIDRIQGRLQFLDRRADMATINISLFPPAAAPKVSNDLPSPLVAAGEAWEASMKFLTRSVAAVTYIVVFFWWTIPIIGLGILWIRGLRNRRQRPATPAAPAAAA